MNQDDAACGALTQREGDVLELLLEGLSSKEIGRRLGISKATVRCHVQHVLTKLGVGSRAKAAVLVRGVAGAADPEAAAGPAEVADAEHERAKKLTPREMQVLRCLAGGLGRSEIAERLFVSPHTARTHVQRVLAKLNVHSVLGAMACARRMGVVPLESAEG